MGQICGKIHGNIWDIYGLNMGNKWEIVVFRVVSGHSYCLIAVNKLNGYWGVLNMGDAQVTMGFNTTTV